MEVVRSWGNGETLVKGQTSRYKVNRSEDLLFNMVTRLVKPVAQLKPWTEQNFRVPARIGRRRRWGGGGSLRQEADCLL